MGFRIVPKVGITGLLVMGTLIGAPLPGLAATAHGKLSAAATSKHSITAKQSNVKANPSGFAAIKNVSPQSVLNTENSNAHTSDQAYWQQASNDFYLSAETDNPSVSGSPSTSLLQVKPNQTLYLFASKNNADVSATGLTWSVNSPDATITTNPAQWQQGSHMVAEATFVATQPGIYTVQASSGGEYSVPLVLTVGMSQLPRKPFAAVPAQMGVQALPTRMRKIAPITMAGVTYDPYPAEGNWIPILGSTRMPLSVVSVVLAGSGSQEWSYRLPVKNGHFSAMVLAPFSGRIIVTIFPHYFQALSQSSQKATDYTFPESSYQVTVKGTAPRTNAVAMLASAQRDFNISPKFAQTASVLLENSATMDTAIAAIANDASLAISYNQSELQTVNYIWQDALTAWQNSFGVCEDYASLAASLLDSVGIATQTVGGWANDAWTTPPASDNNPNDAHEWDQAWDGSKWVVFDPTWNGDNTSSSAHFLTNEFLGNTQSFAATHLPVLQQTGQAF